MPNPLYIFKIEDNDLIGFEQFVKSQTYADEIPLNADLKNYCGLYSIDDFHFFQEDKNLIKRIKKLILETSQSFWMNVVEENPARRYCSWESSTLLKMLNDFSRKNRGKDSGGC